MSYWTLAQHDRASGQFEQAVAFFERSLATLERTKSRSAPLSVESISILGPVVGLPTAGLSDDPAIAAKEKPVLLELLEIATRNDYAGLLIDLGDLQKAEVHIRRAKEAPAILHDLFDFSILELTGSLRRRQWRLDEARDSYKKALEVLKMPLGTGAVAEGRVRMGTFLDLAEIEVLRGRVDDALAWIDRALALMRATKDFPRELAVLQRHAEILAKASRFGGAEKVYSEALALAEKREYLVGEAFLHMSRGRMNNLRGRYGAAAADFEKAVELFARADDPLFHPDNLENLAGVYDELGARDAADMTLERARQLTGQSGHCVITASIDLAELVRKFSKGDVSMEDFRKGIEQWSQTPMLGKPPGLVAQIFAALESSAPVDPRLAALVDPGTFELLQGLVLIISKRQFATGRELALKGLALNPEHKQRAAVLAMVGLSCAAEGDDERGLIFLRKAVDAVETAFDDVRVDPLLGSYLGRRPSQIFNLLVGLLVKTGRYAEAFEVSERARARAFLQLMGNHRITPRGPENTLPAQEAETLRTQLLQWQQQAGGASPGNRNEELRLARRRYEALMTRVKVSNPEYAAVTSVEPLQLDAIRAELPPDTTLVSYFLTDDGAYAWVLDQTMLQYVSLPFGPASRARAQCAAQRFRVGGRGVRRLEEPCEPASLDELYVRLFVPLRGHIRNRRVIIVPHGILHYLPFAAFQDPATQCHLIEDVTITYAPSASSIRFLRDKETPVGGKALVIGAPAGVSPELPGAMREAMTIGNELQSVPMVGAAAKESLLYGLKGEVDLVHIAAHGYYEADTPLFSRVALAPGDGNDGNLEVHEILSEIDLTGVNLVVLSACQTALGKGNAGDEIIGLTRALLYAGTPGVVSTLWDIGDDAAAAIMSNFYCRLLMGDSAADALRHAQLRLLRGDHPDPRHWAAFTLTGDPEGRWNASGAVARGH